MYVVLCVLLCFGAVLCSVPPLENTDHAKYEGHTLFTVRLENPIQVMVMQRLHDDDRLELDFFHGPSIGDHTSFLVPPKSMKTVMMELHTVKVKPKTVTRNFRELADESLRNFRNGQKKGRAFDPFAFRSKYLSLSEMEQTIANLNSSFPSRMKVQSIGSSIEGRDLLQVHISSDFNNPKPAVWVECLTHAREWISGAVCIYTIDRLVRQADIDPLAPTMLQNFDWYFIPVANPDGYFHSHSFDRNWRKNRRHVQGTCYGVDLNRNWKAGYGVIGSSSNCNSQTYRGTEALSEPETLLLRNAIHTTQMNQGVMAFLAIHSYGQMILYPYGYKDERPPDQNDLRIAAESSAANLASIFGTRFTTGAAGDLLYYAGGCSDDHFKEIEGIKFAYTYELRPTDYPYFELPEREIDPSQMETFTGFYALSEEMALYTKR